MSLGMALEIAREARAGSRRGQRTKGGAGKCAVSEAPCSTRAAARPLTLQRPLAPSSAPFPAPFMTLFSSPLVPATTDGVYTETSDSQSETEQLITELISRHLAQPGFDGTPFVLLSSRPCLNAVPRLAEPYSLASFIRPKLEKNLHVNYLGKNLFQLPGAFVSLDASRPWMVYWILHSLDVLGIALDDGTKARYVLILSLQGRLH